MTNDDRLRDLRFTPVWSEAVEPALQERLQTLYKGLANADDMRTTHWLQGAAREIEFLLGDKETDDLKAAMSAEHANHLYPEQDDQEEDIDNGTGRSGVGYDRVARLAEQRGYSTR